MEEPTNEADGQETEGGFATEAGEENSPEAEAQRDRATCISLFTRANGDTDAYIKAGPLFNE